MKAIMALGLGTALLVGSAHAQMRSSGPQGASPIDTLDRAVASSTGSEHMFEFDGDEVLNGVLSFGKSKSRGSSSSNSTNLDLRLNYAYTLPQMPRVQVGGGVRYASGSTAGRGDYEDYGFNIAAYLNHKADLQNSAYISAKWGIDWAQSFGSGNSGKDEVGTFQLAVGQRMDLSRWGIKHLVYTPELAFVNKDSSTRSALEYSQSLELRFLQFSVFF